MELINFGLKSLSFLYCVFIFQNTSCALPKDQSKFLSLQRPNNEQIFLVQLIQNEHLTYTLKENSVCPKGEFSSDLVTAENWPPNRGSVP